MPGPLRLSPALCETALAHLRASDPVMRRVIETVGPFRLKRQTNRYRSLVRAIIAQQISTSAARSILARLEAACGAEGMTPDAIGRLRAPQLKRAGVSPQKQAYLKDLTRRVRERTLRLGLLGRMPDDAVIEQLIEVKGIGVWTAQMFLIFTLGRPDVFPHDDLGVRTAIQRAYGLPELPKKLDAHRVAESWRPYSTVGSWYCWRVLQHPPEKWHFSATLLKPAATPGR